MCGGGELKGALSKCGARRCKMRCKSVCVKSLAHAKQAKPKAPTPAPLCRVWARLMLDFSQRASSP